MDGQGGGEIMREYRKGNWTVQETMILIEAKKMDDERRKISRTSKQQPQQPLQQQPLRWKWVEEYCWRRGCQRSQNQCNDKWDNLMRDYKKVREHQKSLSESSSISTNQKSYWEMDRAERKEKGLPTNMLPQIYQALYDVVERPPPPNLTVLPTTSIVPSPSSAVAEMPVALLPALPPQPRVLLLPPSLPYYSQQEPPPQPSTTLDSESEHSHSESLAKRRKKTTREEEEEAPGGGGTSERAAADATTTQMAMGGPSTSSIGIDQHLQEVGNAISRSATTIVEAIKAREEREERRHREIVGLHQTSLRLQESRMEVHRQGLNALTDAINTLANSILHWANSHKNQGPSS